MGKKISNNMGSNQITTYEVKKSQLGSKIGEIVDWNYQPICGDKYQYVFPIFIDGSVPVMVKSKICKEEFYKACGM